MNILNLISKNSHEPTNSVTSSQFSELVRGAGGGVSSTRAMQITTVFGCDRILMETISSISLHLYTKTAEGKDKAINNPLYDVLNIQPNPNMTSSTWRKMMVHDINMRGTHYSQIIRNGFDEVIAIYPLRHDLMNVEKDNFGNVKYRYLTQNFGWVEVPNSQIVSIFAIPDRDGISGITPIKRAMREFNYASTLQDFGQNFFNRGANASGAFKKDGTLSDEAYKRLKSDINTAFSGMANSGKPMLLEDGLSFERLTIGNNESQFLESKKFSKEEIASIFRVPTHLLNGYDGATFSNIEQLSQEFIQFTMLPWFTTIEQELMVALMTKEQRKKHKILFNVDALLRGDYKTRTEGHANLFRIGVLNQNEIRAYEGRNKVKNGDKYFVEMNMTTTDNINNPIEEEK